MKYTDLAKRQPRHVCVHGLPGSGKSVLATTALEAGYKLFWISLDNGHLVIEKHVDPKYYPQIEIIVIPDTRDSPLAYKALMNIFKGGRCQICDAHGDMSCIICKNSGASFTTCHLNSLGLDTIVVVDHGTQITRSVEAAIANKKKDPDDYKLDWDDWAKNKNIHDRILSAIQAANYNVMFLCNSVDVKLEDNTAKIVPWIGTGNYSASASGFFDSVIFCEIMNRKHMFYSKSTSPTSGLCKSRDDVWIEEMKVPSIAPFFMDALKKSQEYGAEQAAKALEPPVVAIENMPQQQLPANIPTAVADNPSAEVLAARALLVKMQGKIK